ncbi:hypothetical protein OH687_00335 [Burkholderia anthina]|nr:hypothetical protein OH687_00335 [Burkholderia anthina]
MKARGETAALDPIRRARLPSLKRSFGQVGMRGANVKGAA